MSGSEDDNGGTRAAGAAGSGSAAASGSTPVPLASAAALGPTSGAALTEAIDDKGAAGCANPGDTASPEPLLTGIARLKAEQAKLRADRKRVTKELKNAEKRRVRLRKRARQLSDNDLLAVLQMRETSAAQASEAAAAPGSSNASSPASAPANAGAGE